MKKVISTMALVAFLFSMNVNAQEQAKAKKNVVKSEKTSVSTEKKACAMGGKKACCAAKKAEDKK